MDEYDLILELNFINPNGKIGFKKCEIDWFINPIRRIEERYRNVIVDISEDDIINSEKLSFKVTFHECDVLTTLNNILILINDVVNFVEFKILLRADFFNKKSEVNFVNQQSEIQLSEQLVMKLNKSIRTSAFKSEMSWNDLPKDKWKYYLGKIISICQVAVFGYVFCVIILLPMVQKSFGYKTEQEKINEQIISEYNKSPIPDLIGINIDKTDPKVLLNHISFDTQIEVRKILYFKSLMIISMICLLAFYIFKFFKKRFYENNSELLWRISGQQGILILFILNFLIMITYYLFFKLPPFFAILGYVTLYSLYLIWRTKEWFEFKFKNFFLSLESILFYSLLGLGFVSANISYFW